MADRRSRLRRILVVWAVLAAAMALMPAAAADTASVTVSGNGEVADKSYFDLTMGGETYDGWCVDIGHPLENGTYNVTVYDPNDPAGPANVDVWANMDRVAWLLSQEFLGSAATAADGTDLGAYSACDIQIAIWALIDPEPVPAGSCTAGDSARVARLVELALADANEGYTPACGEPRSLILEPEGDNQVTVLFGPVTECSGSITVVKEATGPDAGSTDFAFSTENLTPGTFQLGDGGERVFGDLQPGDYRVAEQIPEGWVLGGVECTGATQSEVESDADGVSIDLWSGEELTCTFTNEPEPAASLTIGKDATPLAEPDATVFQFGGDLGDFELVSGGSQSFAVVPGETVSVTEVIPQGWELSEVSCSGVSDLEELADGVTVTLLENGDAGECIFHNEESGTAGPTGSLTIVKETEPAGAAGFLFDAGALGAFSLDDGESQVFTGLAAGEYTVSETAAEGWQTAGVECTAADFASDGASVTVNLAEGEVVVCTFTNGRLPFTGSQGFQIVLLVVGLLMAMAGFAIAAWPNKRRRATA